jgi:DNA-binding cell septation regulator SpoVG
LQEVGRSSLEGKSPFPVNAETRQKIEQAVLAEYEKVMAGSDPVPSETK